MRRRSNKMVNNNKAKKKAFLMTYRTGMEPPQSQIAVLIYLPMVSKNFTQEKISQEILKV